MTLKPTNTFGARIRMLRRQANLTLAELSERAGVALATLSRVETGRMTGTLESHLAVAKALGIPLPDLYRDVAAETPLVVLRRAKDRNGDQFVYGKGATFQMLTSKVFGKRMMPILLALAPGKTTQPEESQPSVEKFLYVISGAIEARISTEHHRLAAGDSIYFAASLSHQWRNPGKTMARCLCITSPPAL